MIVYISYYSIILILTLSKKNPCHQQPCISFSTQFSLTWGWCFPGLFHHDWSSWCSLCHPVMCKLQLFPQTAYFYLSSRYCKSDKRSSHLKKSLCRLLGDSRYVHTSPSSHSFSCPIQRIPAIQSMSAACLPIAWQHSSGMMELWWKLRATCNSTKYILQNH